MYRVRRSLMLLAFLWAGVSVVSVLADDLTYRWKAGEDFAYQVNIGVEKPTEFATYEGVIRYHVDQSSDEWSQISFTGGMREQIRKKEDPRERDPRNIIIRVPSFPDPFAKRRFRGTSKSTNKITYQRLSTEQMEKIDRDEAEKRDALKRRMDQRNMELATPLKIGEKRRVLKTLASGSDIEVIRTLNDLSQRKLENPDATVAAAIEKRLDDSNRSIAQTAKNAMRAGSPYRRIPNDSGIS